MDPLDLEDSAGDDSILITAIPFPDGQIGQALVLGSYFNGDAPIHRGLIHMDDDRLRQLCKRLRCVCLHEGEHSLGDIGDHNAARAVRFLSSDDLAVLDHMEDCAGEGITGVVQLQQFDFDAGIVLKN